MSTRLELIDTATASEEKLRRLHEFYIMRDTWDLPDDAPMPFEQRLVGWRYFGEGARRVPRWILWDSDTVAATSGVALENSEDNRDNCWGFTYVHPDHRGKGFSRQAITPMMAAKLEVLLTEHPEVEKIDTENAGSNEPIINIAPGFKPVLESRTWQGSIAMIRANLGV